eukprot:569869_1
MHIVSHMHTKSVQLPNISYNKQLLNHLEDPNIPLQLPKYDRFYQRTERKIATKSEIQEIMSSNYTKLSRLKSATDKALKKGVSDMTLKYDKDKGYSIGKAQTKGTKKTKSKGSKNKPAFSQI